MTTEKFRAEYDEMPLHETLMANKPLVVVAILMTVLVVRAAGDGLVSLRRESVLDYS